MASIQGEKFCLRWNDFEKNISSSFRELKEDKDFFDVTIACDDNQIQGHKVILSACSPFFRSVLKRNPHQHPLLYMKGVKYEEILLVLNFMYHGEVNVAQDELNSFLTVAEDLQVKGLSQNQPNSSKSTQESNSSKKYGEEEPKQLPHPRQTYKQPRRNSTYSQGFTEKLQSRRDYQEPAPPQIKTEAPAVIECDEELENTQQLVESSDYQAESVGYEYEQNYQEDSFMYQEGEMQMHTGQQDNTQDPYGHIKQYAVKIPHETGYSCALCGKKCRDMYLMREHVEALHDLSPGYICSVCNKELKSHRGLKEHVKKTHKY